MLLTSFSGMSFNWLVQSNHQDPSAGRCEPHFHFFVSHWSSPASILNVLGQDRSEPPTKGPRMMGTPNDCFSFTPPTAETMDPGELCMWHGASLREGQCSQNRISPLFGCSFSQFCGLRGCFSLTPKFWDLHNDILAYG